MGRCKRLLDGARADPAKEIQRAAGFVVGAAASCTAKRLLANHGAGWFVVDVEITGTVAQRSGSGLDVASVFGEDGTGQGILRGGVAQFQGGFEIIIRINVDRENWSEDFLGHGLASRVVAHDGCGLNEVARAVIVGAASDDFTIGVGRSPVDVAGDAVEGLLVDDGAQEVAEIADVADGDLVDFGDVIILDGVPNRAGDVDTAGGAALLSLKLKSTTEHSDQQGLTVAIGVGDDEVLATGFTDDTRVGFEVLQIVGHVSPHLAEDAG